MPNYYQLIEASLGLSHRHAPAVTRSATSIPNDQMTDKYDESEEILSRTIFHVGDTVGDCTVGKKAGATISRNPLFSLVGGTGLEPVTLAL